MVKPVTVDNADASMRPADSASILLFDNFKNRPFFDL